MSGPFSAARRRMMTQTQVAAHLADKLGISKKQAKSALEELTGLVVRELKKEGSLRLAGLGIFRTHAPAFHPGKGAQRLCARCALSRACLDNDEPRGLSVASRFAYFPCAAE